MSERLEPAGLWRIALALFLVCYGIRIFSPSFPELALGVIAFLTALLVLIGK